jgi:hypothetical protein
MERTYDSNLILNKVFSGSALDVRIDSNEILNLIYDNTNEALKVNIQNLPAGGAGVSATNEVLINVVDDAVVGKQYKTFADAFAYIATQTPSATNTFAVRFSGIITENLMIPEFVTVVGDDMYTSIIDGTVQFEALGSQILNTNNISNCTIGTLIGTSTVTPITSTVATSVPYVPKTISYTFDTTPTSGTYTITIAGAITTAAIDFDASLTEIRDAIRILNPILLGAIDVIAGGTDEYVVVFYGVEADSPVGLTVNTANLLPSTPGTPDFFTGQVSGMSTDVTVTADNDGVLSGIELNFNGSLTITLAISDWNTLNPSNTCTLTSGDGSQIPANKAKITLGGGTDPSLITVTSDAQLGDVEEQTIAFSEEAPTGTWTVDLTYDGTTYTSPVITSNNDTTALDNALLDIVSQVLVDKSVNLGIPVSTYNSGTFTFTITFEGFPGESAELVVTPIDLSLINSQFMGIDNCKILSALGTGSNGIIANNCVILGGDFSSFDENSTFFTNSYVFAIAPTILNNAQLFSSFVYILAPGSMIFDKCTIISSSILGYDLAIVTGKMNIANSKIDGDNLVVTNYTTIIASDLSDFQTITVDLGGNLSLTACSLGTTILTNNGVLSNLGEFYDNTTSALTAQNTQAAIDELVVMINSGSGGIIDVTYAELVILILSNALVAESEYKITDFNTVSPLDISISLYDYADPEPLIVKASGVSTLYANVRSEMYPTDVIIYEVSNTDNGANTGKIVFRRDPVQDVETYYDFRNTLFRKYAAKVLQYYAFFTGVVPGMTTDGTITADVPGTIGNSIALIANSTDTITAMIATWNAANPTNACTLTTGDGTQIPTNNIKLAGGTASYEWVMNAAYSEGDIIYYDGHLYLCVKDIAATPNTPNTYSEFLNILLYDYSVFPYMICIFDKNMSKINGQVIIIDKNNHYDWLTFNGIYQSFESIHLGNSSDAIFIGESSSINIGEFSTDNVFFGKIKNVKLGSYSEYNILSKEGTMNNLSIGNYATNNVVYAGNTLNVEDSVFGNYFSDNVVSGLFQNNTIGNYCGYSSGNIFPSTFLYNKVSDNLSGVNFSDGNSTHARGQYDCELFRRVDGTFKLRYLDNTDNIVISEITD